MRPPLSPSFFLRFPALAGALLVLAGSFLTWAAADVPFLGRVELDGFDAHRDGVATLVLGAALVAVLAVPIERAWPGALLSRVLAAGLGAAALAVAVSDAAELAGRKTIVDGWGLGLVDTEVGAGLILVIVGASLALAAILLSLLFVWRAREAREGDER